ncbi:MAG: EamA family transporter [Solirubrobacterales bacterium]
MTSWLLPTLLYVVLLGALGVTGKLALRNLVWQELLLWTALAYTICAVAFLVLGNGVKLELDTWWAVASAAIVPAALVVLYVALGNGEASKIIPISAAYPAVTLLLAALFLDEAVTALKLAGLALVLVGVVLLTVAE